MAQLEGGPKSSEIQVSELTYYLKSRTTILPPFLTQPTPLAFWPRRHSMAAQSKFNGSYSTSMFPYLHSLSHTEDPPSTPSIYPKLDTERKGALSAVEGLSVLDSVLQSATDYFVSEHSPQRRARCGSRSRT